MRLPIALLVAITPLVGWQAALGQTWPDHRWDRWYAGNAGVHFTNGTVLPLLGNDMNGSSDVSVSDPATGELLFYSNGFDVRNADHQLMPNGSGLLGGFAALSVAVAKPGSGHKHYILYGYNNGTQYDLMYALVDMDLDNGSGDVVSKNVVFQNGPIAMRLCPVPSVTGDTLWIFGHELNSKDFTVVPLTAAGFGQSMFAGQGQYEYGSASFGEMKATWAGDRMVYNYSDMVEVVHVDRVNGTVLPFRWLATPPNFAPSVEFSPDGTKLYAGIYGTGAYCVQFDLSLADSAAVQDNMYVLDTTDQTASIGGRRIQCGPDGRLYTSQYAQQSTPRLGIITDPNLAGAACGYHRDTVLAAFGVGMFPYMSALPRLYWPVQNPADGIADVGSGLSPLVASPNPASGTVLLLLGTPSTNDVEVSWIDALGRLVRSTAYGSSERIAENVADLSSGTYVVRVSRKGTLCARGTVAVMH